MMEYKEKHVTNPIIVSQSMEVRANGRANYHDCETRINSIPAGVGNPNRLDPGIHLRQQNQKVLLSIGPHGLSWECRSCVNTLYTDPPFPYALMG